MSRRTNSRIAQSKRGRLTRRDLLARAAGVVGAAATAPVAGQQSIDTTRRLGRGPNGLDQRSPFVTPRRDPSSTSSRTPLQDLRGTITPADLHFERHHGGVPEIDPGRYELLVHGMVDRPTVFNLADLQRFPSTSRTCFLECSGNLRRGGPETPPQMVCGLTSQTEWTGVMLSALFAEVGADPNATWFLAEGQDAAVMTRSIPTEKAFDDAMVVYAQNGDALMPGNGYPARLLLPGWEGNASVKWLRRIELADQPFMTREETSKYTDTLADGTSRKWTWVMDAKSVVTSPSPQAPITHGHGPVVITGMAWTGHGKITRVDVSKDGGKTWETARLAADSGDKALVRFYLDTEWNGEEWFLQSRAMDETGYVQPTKAQLREVRGLNSIYHNNCIQTWWVKPNGEAENVEVS